MNELIFDSKPLVTTFVDKLGEVHTVAKSRYRTIVDLQGYNDSEKTKNPSITDTTDYLPLREQILRFFPDGRFPDIDGYEDVDNFDTEITPEDKLDFVDSMVEKLNEERDKLSTTPEASEQLTQKASEQAKDVVDNLEQTE